MHHRTDLIAPSWATEHRIDEGVIWSRETAVDAAACAGADPYPVRVHAALMDQLVVQNGHVIIDRDDTATVTVDTIEMTIAQARQLAYAILSIVDAVDGSAAVAR